jgi:hypothetical protein
MTHQDLLLSFQKYFDMVHMWQHSFGDKAHIMAAPSKEYIVLHILVLESRVRIPLRARTQARISLRGFVALCRKKPCDRQLSSSGIPTNF